MIHRDRVHICGGDARHRIGHPGAAGDQRHADLVAAAGVGVGGVHRRLLVPHQNVLEAILLEDLVVDVEDRATGIPEDVLDPFFRQAPDDDFGACDLFVLRFRPFDGCGFRADGLHAAIPLKIHGRLIGCRSLPACGRWCDARD